VNYPFKYVYQKIGRLYTEISPSNLQFNKNWKGDGNTLVKNIGTLELKRSHCKLQRTNKWERKHGLIYL